MAYQIGFLDKDICYGRALMEYVNMRAKVPLEMSVFSEVDTLLDYVKRKPISLLLVGDGCSAPKVECPVVFLTAEKAAQDGRAGGPEAIYRYQNAGVILEQILKHLAKAASYSVDTSAFLAVYSPVGRCGKSALAKELSANLGKCILVRWEGFSGEEEETEQGSRFLYLLKSRNPEIEELLEQGEPLAVVPNASDYRDIRQIDAEDIRWFREKVKERGNGVCVVFDIGSTVPGDLNLLREFDCVYMPYLSDSASRKKVEHWNNLAGAQWDATDAPTFQTIDMTNQNVREVTQYVLKGRLW